jgi:hypothetical protein
MLGIDGQLRAPGGVEELMRYALERLRTGIAALPRQPVRPKRSRDIRRCITMPSTVRGLCRTARP